MSLLKLIDTVLGYRHDRKLKYRPKTTVPNQEGYFRNVSPSPRVQDEQWVWVSTSERFRKPLWVNVFETVEYHFSVTLDASPSPSSIESMEVRTPRALEQTMVYVKNYYGSYGDSIRLPDESHIERMIRQSSNK